ncbi:type 2A phosphatase activator TIP41 [Phellopilus nigrolimitatus]|nr:type 2A phosphatase activator TIP41 [Phellopilus nigrolimitatus]
MNTVAKLPEHKVSEDDGERSIDISGWRITATTKSIVTASEADALQNGWTYAFDAAGALGRVKNGELVEGDGGVKVGYADAWLKSRTEPGSALPMPKTVPTKPYDWTYTTVYAGAALDDAAPVNFVPADPNNPAHTIPLAELMRPDPILFYAEIPLFEDELHDNGSSHLVVRIRVMPGCIFVLSRFTLRVDNVLFRSFDTRIYHSFMSSPPLVIRETSGWEAPYNDVKSFLPGKHDLTPLTDANFIGKTLGALPKAVSQGKGAGTGWRALGTSTEVAILENAGVDVAL